MFMMMLSRIVKVKVVFIWMVKMEVWVKKFGLMEEVVMRNMVFVIVLIFLGGFLMILVVLVFIKLFFCDVGCISYVMYIILRGCLII